MRNGQKRMRGRNNHHRKNHNPLTRVYESNGPDVKIRGTASHVAEKYIQLARDAQSSGDPIAAENYYQHAEHYFRLIAAAQEQFRQQNPYYNQQQQGQQGQPNQGGQQPDGDDDFDDGDDSQTFMGQNEPGYQQSQPQPYPPRDAQPFQQHQQNHNQQHNNQQHNNQQQQHHRPQHQQNNQQPNYQQNQPNSGNDGGQDASGLPSFITGGGQRPQQQNFGGQNNQGNFGGQNNQGNYGGNGYEGNRFRHGRRRHRGGYRPDYNNNQQQQQGQQPQQQTQQGQPQPPVQNDAGSATQAPGNEPPRQPEN